MSSTNHSLAPESDSATGKTRVVSVGKCPLHPPGKGIPVLFEGRIQVHDKAGRTLAHPDKTVRWRREGNVERRVVSINRLFRGIVTTRFR